MWLRILLISALAVLWFPTASAAPDKIFCYHTTWSHWRSGNGKFVIADIDTNLCTHVVYAFVGINSDGTIRLSSSDADFLTEYGKLKNRTSQPKLLISIGGWTEGSINFSLVSANATLRKRLLDSAVALIQKYNFDGFNFHWAYPGATEMGGGPNDSKNFVTLLEEFRTEFNKYNYLLTAVVSASTGYYDVPGIAKSLHYIGVMTYDFAGSWDSVTGHHSSYPESINRINIWKNAGAPANKLFLGIGTYGRSFTLSNTSNNLIGAPVKGGGNPGSLTGEGGILGYNENLRAGWTRRWSNDLSAPYAFNGDQWVGYDDVESISKKGKFVADNDLAGVMVWSVDTDDFRGACGGGSYPLLKAIKASLPVKTIICYHGTWSHWRSGNGKFVVSDIDTNLCTHVMYAFVGINNNGTIRLNSNDPGFFNEYKKLKDRNPKPKLLIAIGGWSEGSAGFSTVAANPSSRKRLLDHAVSLIQQYNFDGFDFDWEYPGDRGGGPNDSQNFVTLLSEFSTEFKKYGYLLTAAVSASTRYYDVPGISKYLDLIGVMTYDFAGSWNSVTGHHSSYRDSTNSINNWKNAGAPINKLVLGIGLYGRSFTLTNSSNNGIGAPVRGGGAAGPYTGEIGILGYNEICEYLMAGWTRRWSNDLQVPFAFRGDQWVGYDDVQSIAIKGKFVVDNGLAGILIWSVETDDFRGICGAGRYPLLNAIKTSLQNSGARALTNLATVSSSLLPTQFEILSFQRKFMYSSLLL